MNTKQQTDSQIHRQIGTKSIDRQKTFQALNNTQTTGISSIDTKQREITSDHNRSDITEIPVIKIYGNNARKMLDRD